ncbi:YopX family protein [Psychrobacillus psychrotolerans]|uniref:YopX family protein n=1 Tax=Psychrobacillus psychrotolerans TaxID=126156 RepID=UPI003B01E864
MSRDVKFRGYAVDEMVGSQWMFGTGIHKIVFTDEYAAKTGVKEESFVFTESGWIHVDPNSIGQYTGLKGKNGVEIFEGDIVRFVNFDTTGGHRGDSEHTGVVKYQSGIYEIWKNVDSEYYGSNGAFILNHAWLQDDEFEVIGNIYEHPNLLGVAQ